MRICLSKVKKALTDKEILFSYASELGLFHFMNDEMYLKMMYKVHMGKTLHLDHPQTFNEKLQWLKIHDRNPLYTTMVDKYAVKKYVADKIGEQYIIPTLGVWDHFDDIDFDALPNQFVLKCTHDSGGLVICKDKGKLDKKAAKAKIEKCLKRNYYWSGREWPYKNVKPRIIAEKYMTDDMNTELNDYKLMCFNSKVKATFVCTNRFSDQGLNVTFYDTNWEKLPFERHYPMDEKNISKPISYEEMVRVAEKLAQRISFVRVDFYEIKGKPYFGEMTFYPGSGIEEFNPEQWDKTLGDLIALPKNMGGYLVLHKRYTLWIHKQWHDDEMQGGLTDYKFYSFSGEPQYLYVSDHLEDHSKAHMMFADMDYKQASFNRSDFQHFDTLPPKPHKFEEMKRIVKALSKSIPFVRVDLYEINQQVYFGELTFHPCSGFMPFEPEQWDEKLGEVIRLPKNRGGYLIVCRKCVLWVHDSQDTRASISGELTDYKFFCFGGKVDNVMICLDRGSGDTKFYFFSPEWKLLRINKRGRAAPADFNLPKPVCWEEMVSIAERLSQNLAFARIDLYQCKGKVYFGEITFFPDSGFDSNILPDTDLAWGKLLKIS